MSGYLSQFPVLPAPLLPGDLVEVSRPRAGEPDRFDSFKTDITNLTAPQGSQLVHGVVEMTTRAEAIAGTDDERAVSDDALAAVMNNVLQNRIVAGPGVTLAYDPETGALSVSSDGAGGPPVFAGNLVPAGSWAGGSGTGAETQEGTDIVLDLTGSDLVELHLIVNPLAFGWKAGQAIRLDLTKEAPAGPSNVTVAVYRLGGGASWVGETVSGQVENVPFSVYGAVGEDITTVSRVVLAFGSGVVNNTILRLHGVFNEVS